MHCKICKNKYGHNYNCRLFMVEPPTGKCYLCGNELLAKRYGRKCRRYCKDCDRIVKNSRVGDTQEYLLEKLRNTYPHKFI